MQITIATGQSKTRVARAPEASKKRRKSPKTGKDQARKRRVRKQRQALVEQFFVAKDAGFSGDYRTFARFAFVRQMVAKGVFTDFPGQLQVDGAANLHNYSWEASQETARDA